MLYGNDHSQNLECPLFHMFQYMKVISCAVENNLHPGVEAYGKIPAHDSSCSRNPCSHRCKGELKITADRSILKLLFIVFNLLLSVLQKLKVVQGTSEHSNFRN